MRKLALAAALAATFFATAAALAALPRSGNFTGTTSAHSLNGFRDLVTFVSSHGGRTLRDFQFGTLGCVGTGAFPVGVDPFALAYAEATISSLPVNSKGVIAYTGKPFFAETDGIATTATVKATFSNPKALSGTIAVSQTENGGTCGPVTMKFSAVPGTPESLGLQGP